MEYRQLNANSVLRRSDGATIPFCENDPDYQKYLAWIAQGYTPDPSFTLEETRTIAQETIRANGTRTLEEGGYSNWKQLQMALYSLGEVIKGLKDVIASTGAVVDSTKLDTILSAIPVLTDLTFPQVVALATEIGKVRGSVNAGEEAISAAPTAEAALHISNTAVIKPKDRRKAEKEALL